MPLQIVRNDIIKVHADAIVNTANPRPVVGGGTDTGIYAAAGNELLLARQAIGEIPRGTSVITPAFRLYDTNHIKYIIHTVGTPWRGGDAGEVEILRSCYTSALKLAAEKGCKSVAFPLLASGSYGFPDDVALQVANESLRAFLKDYEMFIYLVLFRSETVKLAMDMFSNSFIEMIGDDYALEQEWKEYLAEGGLRRTRRRWHKSPYDEDFDTGLRQRLKMCQPGFADSVKRIMAERGLQPPQVYNRVHMSPQLFNKAVKLGKHPSRQTAIQLAIALELPLGHAVQLLATAGYALGNSDPADLIIKYFLQTGNYDIDALNDILEEYELDPLSR